MKRHAAYYWVLLAGLPTKDSQVAIEYGDVFSLLPAVEETKQNMTGNKAVNVGYFASK